MKKNTTVICNFTGVYAKQSFFQNLRLLDNVKWLDFSQLSGTNGYCDNDAFNEITKKINNLHELTNNALSPIHFVDNGNFHYMSKIWTDFITEPFSLIVFDHHPDMQSPRFNGILSCGSWIKQVLETNEFVQNVIVIGVSDSLVDENTEDGKILHQDCAHILNKVTFIKESEIANKNFCNFTNDSRFFNISKNIYLSIDKDVFSPNFALTNWDPGSLTLEQLKSFIKIFSHNHNILGIDICGECSLEQEQQAYSSVNPNELNNHLNKELYDFFLAL